MQLLYNKDCNTEPSSGLVKGLATKPDHLTRLTRYPWDSQDGKREFL